jgi:hypothetical protein
MTEAAQKYFRLYYKLQRFIDEMSTDVDAMEKLRGELDIAYNAMTERERELLDIVGKNNIKE